MHPLIKRNIVTVLIVCCCFGYSAHAQLASSKNLSAFYTKKISEELSENNANKSLPPPQQNRHSFVSNDRSLNEMAESKIKNPSILQHKASETSPEKIKKNLPGNSAHLKQLGHPVIKSRPLNNN
jgi:hypothetical protein